MTDLIERLRFHGDNLDRDELNGFSSVCFEAADTIESQASLLNMMREALEPLLAAADEPADMPSGKFNPGDVARASVQKLGLALLEQLPSIREALATGSPSEQGERE